MAIARPSPAAEFAIVKVVNYVVFLICLLTFGWFLRQLRDAYRDSVLSSRTPALPDWAWIVGGYTLFLWSSIRWITLTTDTPDMCAATATYGAWGCLLRMERRDSRFDPLWLGITLALGYFSRTPMFIVAGTMLLGVALWSRDRRTWLRAAATAAVFAMLTGPFIIWLSLSRGHVTIGDNGKLITPGERTRAPISFPTVTGRAARTGTDSRDIPRGRCGPRPRHSNLPGPSAERTHPGPTRRYWFTASSCTSMPAPNGQRSSTTCSSRSRCWPLVSAARRPRPRTRSGPPADRAIARPLCAVLGTGSDRPRAVPGHV